MFLDSLSLSFCGSYFPIPCFLPLSTFFNGLFFKEVPRSSPWRDVLGTILRERFQLISVSWVVLAHWMEEERKIASYRELCQEARSKCLLLRLPAAQFIPYKVQTVNHTFNYDSANANIKKEIRFAMCVVFECCFFVSSVLI